jgi:DNA-binding MarR family transcriptional regulator
MGGTMANAVNQAMARELAELQLELKKRQWWAAVRWRERMRAYLSTSGLTFTEWLVLDTTWSLVNRTGDAVSQNELARDLELDALTIWHAMAVLDHRGLVSRGCSISGKAWRVFVTSKGADLLRTIKPGLEGASASA